MTPRITSVEARSGHQLLIGFDNGETRIFDVTPYLDRGIFQELRDESYFRRVRAIRGGIEWPNEQDLSAGTLYLQGKPTARDRAVRRSAGTPRGPARTL